MTSSIAHIPSGSIPFSQHSEVRNPGFSEIQNVSTLTRLIPILTRHANVLARAETQNQVRFTQGKYIVYTSDADLTSNPALLFQGAAELANTITISNINIKDEQLDNSFRTVFGRDAKVGDSVEFVVKNSSGSSVTISTTNVSITILDSKLLYSLINKTSTGWRFTNLRVR